MPPKRKRADDATAATGDSGTSTRATRASTRGSKKSTKATSDGVVEPADSVEAGPATKKPKNKASKSKSVTEPSSSAVQTAGKTGTKGVDEPAHSKATIPPPKPVLPLKNEPYTPQRSLSLFQSYADSDNPNVIGPESFETLCSAANIPLDGSLPLILAWQMQAKEMAKISKDEWVKATESLKISSLSQLTIALTDLENLLILGKPSLKKSAKKDQDPYDRTLYYSYADDAKAAFQKFYMFCFSLAKPEQSRNIDMETSMAFWSVLLTPHYPVMKEVLQFITERQGTYRAANKDLWSMMLEFCVTVKPTLQDYEADGAWPTLLDDYVAWKKSKTSADSLETD